MVYRWSKTASSNATADSSINWAEGMAPSAVNDSARAEMARVAQWRDDISATIATGGTSTAFTVTSNQGFDTLAHLDGAIIAFVPHTTSGAAPTLSVDGLTAKKIRFQTGVDLPSNSLVQSTPYVATYYNTAGEFLIHNIAGNPYNIPLAAGMDYWGLTTPNSAFAFPTGQAISRTTYASLFSLIGTTYGIGDGSTTFNLPDKGERVSIMKVSTASRVTTAGSGIDSTSLNGIGGLEAVNIAQANLPNVNFSVTIPSGQGSHVHTMDEPWAPGLAGNPSGGVISASGSTTFTSNAAVLPQMTGTAASGGSGSAHQNMPPTIVCNYIIRII